MKFYLTFIICLIYFTGNAQIILPPGTNIDTYSDASEGDIYKDENDIFYIGIQDGSLKEIGVVTLKGSNHGDILSWDTLTLQWQPNTASSSSNNAWNLLGNSGTTAGTNFLGTIDDQDLVFKVNNITAGRIATTSGSNPFQNSLSLGSNTVAGKWSTFIGAYAGSVNSSMPTELAVAVGYNAKTSRSSVAIGPETSNQGENAVSVGYDANSNTNSIAIGTIANSSGEQAVAIGRNSDASTDQSIAIGNNSNANTGTGAISIGRAANSTTRAVAVGDGANASASNGVALGNSTNTSGTNGIAIGNTANAYGTSGIAIGTNAQANNNSVAIGASTNAFNANTIILGTNQDVGVGNSIPTAKLDVDGDARIRDLPDTNQSDYIVTADSDGNLLRKTIRLFDAFDNSGNQSITTSFSRLNINNQRINMGGFTFSNGRVTFPESGIYRVSYSATYQIPLGTSQRRTILTELRKNNTPVDGADLYTYHRINNSFNSSSQNVVSTSTGTRSIIIEVNANEYLELFARIFEGPASALRTVADGTSISIEKLN